MKIHCRCKSCRHRKALPQLPEVYRVQPKCSVCGSRNWRADSYRNTVEREQIRKGLGRYRVCHSDCYPFHHRIGFGSCKFTASGEYKD